MQPSSDGHCSSCTCLRLQRMPQVAGPMCMPAWDDDVRKPGPSSNLHGNTAAASLQLGWTQAWTIWHNALTSRNILALLHQTEGYSLLLRYPVTLPQLSILLRIKMPAVNHTVIPPPSSHCPSDKFSQGSLPQLAATVTEGATRSRHGCPASMLLPFPAIGIQHTGKDEQLGMGKTRRFV